MGPGTADDNIMEDNIRPRSVDGRWLMAGASKLVFAKTGSVFELRFSVFYFLKTGFIRFSVFSKMLQLPHPSMNFEEFFAI